MKRFIGMATITFVLVGCLPEENTDEDASDDQDEVSGTITHNICGNTNSVVEARLGIDQSVALTMLDSIIGVQAKVADISVPFDDLGKWGGVLGALTAVGTTDSTVSFNQVYDCDSANYQANQCQREIDGIGAADDDIRISTNFTGQDYEATVEVREPNMDYEIYALIEGTLGDRGNGKISVYDGGLVTTTKSYSRDANGTESIAVNVDNAIIWSGSETADCSGNVSYSYTDEDGVHTLTANWTMSGTAFTGQLNYSDPDFVGTYQLNF